MKLFIEGEIRKYGKDIGQVDQLMEDIYEILDDRQRVLEALEIDGERVCVDFGEYIFRNISSIEEIHVESLELGDFIESIFLSGLDYVTRALPALDRLIESIDYREVSDLLEGISWLTETFTYIDGEAYLNRLIERREEWNLYALEVYKLVEILPDLMQALAARDDFKLTESLLSIREIFKAMEKSLVDLLEVR